MHLPSARAFNTWVWKMTNAHQLHALNFNFSPPFQVKRHLEPRSVSVSATFRPAELWAADSLLSQFMLHGLCAVIWRKAAQRWLASLIQPVLFSPQVMRSPTPQFSSAFTFPFCLCTPSDRPMTSRWSPHPGRVRKPSTGASARLRSAKGRPRSDSILFSAPTLCLKRQSPDSGFTDFGDSVLDTNVTLRPHDISHRSCCFSIAESEFVLRWYFIFPRCSKKNALTY